jgi:hypothetical protein
MFNLLGSRCMAAVNGSLYVIQGKDLIRVNTADGSCTVLGDGDWTGSTCIAALDGSLYIVQGPYLVWANPADGGWTVLGDGDWTGSTCMAAVNGSLYIVQGQYLVWANPADGGWAVRGDGEWTGSTCMAAVNDSLYIVQGRYLVWANPADGGWAVRGDGEWTGSTCMAAVNGSLHIVQDKYLVWANPADGSWAVPWPPNRSMTAEEKRRFRGYFPDLDVDRAQVTAEQSGVYNCISWTVGVTNRWIWPGETLALFDKFYKGLGFVRDDANGEVAAWGFNASSMTHGSIAVGGRWWESKCGRDLRILHEKDELVGASYGHIITRYRKARDAARSVKSRLGKGTSTMVQLSRNQQSVLKKAVTQCPKALRKEFALRYARWLDAIQRTPRVQVSSDPAAVRHLDEFRDLVALGESIVPLIVEKLVDPGQFMAVQVYEALVSDSEKAVRRDPRDILEGEQGKAARTVQHWLAATRPAQ